MRLFISQFYSTFTPLLNFISPSPHHAPVTEVRGLTFRTRNGHVVGSIAVGSLWTVDLCGGCGGLRTVVARLTRATGCRQVHLSTVIASRAVHTLSNVRQASLAAEGALRTFLGFRCLYGTVMSSRTFVCVRSLSGGSTLCSLAAVESGMAKNIIQQSLIDLYQEFASIH
jgi:hypothetical protein